MGSSKKILLSHDAQFYVTQEEKTTHTFHSFSNFTSQRLCISNCISVSEPERQYSKTSEEVYKMIRGGGEVSVCKLVSVSTLGLTNGRLQYSRKLMMQHGTSPSDSRIKHDRPNREPDKRKQLVHDFSEPMHPHKSYYMSHHNPNQEYLPCLQKDEHVSYTRMQWHRKCRHQ
jgi:hypothetical protein